MPSPDNDNRVAESIKSVSQSFSQGLLNLFHIQNGKCDFTHDIDAIKNKLVETEKMIRLNELRRDFFKLLLEKRNELRNEEKRISEEPLVKDSVCSSHITSESMENGTSVTAVDSDSSVIQLDIFCGNRKEFLKFWQDFLVKVDSQSKFSEELKLNILEMHLTTSAADVFRMIRSKNTDYKTMIHSFAEHYFFSSDANNNTSESLIKDKSETNTVQDVLSSTSSESDLLETLQNSQKTIMWHEAVKLFNQDIKRNRINDICIFCKMNGSHSPEFCCAISESDQRREMVSTLNLCSCCLLKHSGVCTKTCRVCHLSHHVSLCVNEKYRARLAGHIKKVEVYYKRIMKKLPPRLQIKSNKNG